MKTGSERQLLDTVLVKSIRIARAMVSKSRKDFTPIVPIRLLSNQDDRETAIVAHLRGIIAERINYRRNNDIIAARM